MGFNDKEPSVINLGVEKSVYLSDKAETPSWITPEQFYKEEDLDDTYSIQSAINEAQLIGGTIKGKTGKTYTISSPLLITSPVYFEFNNSTIKVSSSISDNILSVFNINITNKFYCAIKDVTIDCNYKANIGVHVLKNIGFELNNVKIFNPYTHGIKLDGGGIQAHKVNIRNVISPSTNRYAIGVYIGSSSPDTIWNDVMTVNFNVGFENHANVFYTHCHPWMSDPQSMINSIGFNVFATAKMIHCYPDTYYISFYNHGNNAIDLIDAFVFLNSSYYNSTAMPDLPPYLFKFDNASDFGGVNIVGLNAKSPLDYPSNMRFSNFTSSELVTNMDLYMLNKMELIDGVPTKSEYINSINLKTEWVSTYNRLNKKNNRVVGQLLIYNDSLIGSNYRQGVGTVPNGYYPTTEGKIFFMGTVCANADGTGVNHPVLCHFDYTTKEIYVVATVDAVGIGKYIFINFIFDI